MKYRIVQLIDRTFVTAEGEDIAALSAEHGFAQDGTHQNPQTRPQLQGQPTFAGLCGPMWGDGVVLYEDNAAANAILNASLGAR